MKSIRTLIGVSTVLLMIHPANAAGLIQKLPQDGSWITYHMTQTSVRNGVAGTEGTGTLTIRSVGAVLEEGKACRWLEFEYRFVDGEGNGNSVEYVKVLIPVENLKRGQEPLDHVVRAWQKFDAKPAMRVEEKMPVFADDLILAGPLKDRNKAIQPRFVDYQNGRLELKNVVTGKTDWSGKPSPTAKKLQTTTRHQLWPHEDVPFGVAFAKQELRMYRDGKHFRSVFRELTLSDFGTGAKSALPDAK